MTWRAQLTTLVQSIGQKAATERVIETDIMRCTRCHGTCAVP